MDVTDVDFNFETQFYGSCKWFAPKRALYENGRKIVEELICGDVEMKRD